MKSYCLKIRDFMKAIAVGNYTIFYCILEDRIHFEMPTEFGAFSSQKFLKSVIEDVKREADNYLGDPVTYYLKKIGSGRTMYQYYPSKKQILDIMNTKLYSKLIVREYKVDTELNNENDEFEEDDFELRIVNSELRIWICLN